MPAVSRLRRDRVPASVEEAQRLIAYNERILASSDSPQRRVRAERMLENVRAELARLERDEAARLARIEVSAPSASSFDGRVQQWRDERRAEKEPEFETAWNGAMGRQGKSLCSWPTV